MPTEAKNEAAASQASAAATQAAAPQVQVPEPSPVLRQRKIEWSWYTWLGIGLVGGLAIGALRNTSKRQKPLSQEDIEKALSGDGGDGDAEVDVEVDVEPEVDDG